MAIRVVSKPDSMPGYRVTDLGTTGESVDIGVDLEYHSGAVFISKQHALDIGAAVGMSNQEYVQELESALAEIEETLQRYRNASAKLVDDVRELFESRLLSLDLGTGSEPSSSGSTAPGEGSSGAQVRPSDEKADRKGTVKSNPGSRASRVPANASDDFAHGDLSDI